MQELISRCSGPMLVPMLGLHPWLSEITALPHPPLMRAECSAFPGMWYHLSLFYSSRELGPAYAKVATCTALAQVIGAPLAAAILSLDGWLGLQGWQWLFILEGLPTIAFGVAFRHMLAATPSTAACLTSQERAWLQRRQALAASEGEGVGLKPGSGQLRAVLSKCPPLPPALQAWGGVVHCTHFIKFTLCGGHKLTGLSGAFGHGCSGYQAASGCPCRCAAGLESAVAGGRLAAHRGSDVWHRILCPPHDLSHVQLGTSSTRHRRAECVQLRGRWRQQRAAAAVAQRGNGSAHRDPICSSSRCGVVGCRDSGDLEWARCAEQF